MKTIVSIVALIIAIIGWFAPNWIADKPDVRYTLSEKISVSLSNEKTKEDIQQLVIKNVGNSKAEKIQLKINATVTNVELQKFSQSDKPEQYSSDNLTEIVYPELPPKGSFTVIIKTVGGITTRDLSINHQKGVAIDALSKKDFNITDIIFGIGSFIYLIFMIAWVLWGIQDWLRNRFDNEIRWQENDSFLERNKPIYFSKEKWIKLRQGALERKIERDSRFCSINDLETSNLYQTLSKDKPNYLDELEWNKIIKKYSEKLNETISRNLDNLSIFYPNEILKLLQLVRPKYYDEKYWIIMRNNIQKKYIEILKYGHYFNLEKAFKELKRPKPTELDEEYWEDYQKFVAKVAFDELNRTLIYQQTPLGFLSQYALDFLPLSEQNEIVERAYKLQEDKIHSTPEAEQFIRESKPDWISKKHYTLLRKKAEDILENDSNKKINQYLLKMFNQVVQGKDLPDNCGGIDQEIWAKLQEYQRKFDEIELMKKQLEEKESQMDKLCTETNDLKEKVLKQLKIINELLQEPYSLTRLEEYDKPFSVGNFENLKRVAKILGDNKC